MPEAPKKSLKATTTTEEQYEYCLAEKNKAALEFIEDVTTNADEVQKKVLAEILTRNARVEYLHRHGLAGYTDRDTFKKLVPVITYEDLQPDINRIANGDTSQILCSNPISEFLTRYSCVGNWVESTECAVDYYYLYMYIYLLYFQLRDVGRGEEADADDR